MRAAWEPSLDSPVCLAQPMWPVMAHRAMVDCAPRAASGGMENRATMDCAPQAAPAAYAPVLAPKQRAEVDVSDVARSAPAYYFDESRVERGYCKSHRPVGVAHISPGERAARRMRMEQMKIQAHGLKLDIALR